MRNGAFACWGGQLWCFTSFLRAGRTVFLNQGLSRCVRTPSATVRGVVRRTWSVHGERRWAIARVLGAEMNTQGVCDGQFGSYPHLDLLGKSRLLEAPRNYPALSDFLGAM